MSAPDSLAIAAMLDSLANAVDLEYGGADDRTRKARRLASLLRGPNQAVPPTPPPIDADAGAFVEAVDELAAMVGSPFGEDRARRRVLSLYAAALARAEAAERALDAIGRHTHIGAGDADGARRPVSRRYPSAVDRTVRNGAVRIYGRTFVPDPRHMAYDGRCDGLRYTFGLYECGAGLEPFVHQHSLAGSFDDPDEDAVMRGPHCVDGTYPWTFWHAVEVAE